MIGGGNPAIRPDQANQLPRSRAGSGPAPQSPFIIGRIIIVKGTGGGEFVYDAAGNLRSANVGGVTTDPIKGITCQQGFSTFNGFGAVINLLSTAAGKGAFFQYLDNQSAVQGAMILAVASVAGTDPVLGTAYGAGLLGVNPAFGDTSSVVGSTIALSAVPFTRQAFVSVFTGAGATRPGMAVNAPEQTTAEHAQILLDGDSPDGTVLSQIIMGRVSGGAALAGVSKAMAEVQGGFALVNAALPAFVSTAWQEAAVAGVLTAITGSGGLSGALALDQTDATTFTITTTGANQASKAWSIPANDANAGTIYELEVWGTGTEGSTAQNIVVGAAVDGVTIRSATVAALTASGTFRFHCRILLHVVAKGASGTYDLAGDGAWDTTANPGVAGPFVWGSSVAAGEALDFTVIHNFRLNLGWSAVVGGPTITTLGSRFTRRGP